MNKNIFREIIGNFVRRTFNCFSLLVLAVSVCGLINNTDVNSSYLTVNRIMSFFYFSLLFAFVFFLCDFIKNVIIRRCMQFVLTMANVALIFVNGSAYVEQSQNKPFAVMMIFFFAAIIYFVLSLVYLVFRWIMNRMFNSEQEYEQIYKKD